MISSFYYLAFVALVELLFLLVDHRTHPFLVWIAYASAFNSFTVTSILFYAYSSVNSGARSLIPSLTQYHYRRPLSIRMNLKLESVCAQLESNQIGIRCASLFMFTKFHCFILLIHFCLGFIYGS